MALRLMQLLSPIIEATWRTAFLLAVAVSAVYWFMVFDDGSHLQEELSNLSNARAQADKDLQTTKEAMRDADRFDQEVRVAVDQFNHIVDFMPTRLTSADLMGIISEVSKKSGTAIVKTEPRNMDQGGSASKEDFYDTTKIAVSLQGTFAQIETFLSNLSKNPRLITFDNSVLELMPTAGLSKTPKLEFSAVLSGYRYTRDLSKKDGAAETGGGKPGQKAGGAANAN